MQLLRFWNFFVFFRFFPLKLVYFWTKNRKNIYECFFHSFCATDLNFGTKNNGRMKYSTLKTVIFASYWGSLLVQFSKFNNFLWVCWFLFKNHSNFVSPSWQVDNLHYHTWQYSLPIWNTILFHKPVFIHIFTSDHWIGNPKIGQIHWQVLAKLSQGPHWPISDQNYTSFFTFYN